MKTFNTYYINELSLKEFIKQNNIIDSNTTLIQVFTGNNDKNFIGKLILEIDNLLPHSKLIGSTTDGEIKDAKVTANHTVISFNIFKKTTLEVAIFDINNTYFDTGKKLATKIVGDKTKAIISFIDGLGGNGEEFLNGISSVNTNIKIAGGLAGDNAKFNHTFVFTKEHILEHGAVGVSLNSDSLKIYTDFSFHWSSIGVNLKITKAIQNRVYTINDKSAYDTYAYYLGDNVAKKLPALGIEFPLIVKRKEMDIARAVTATMEDGSLIFAGNLQTGDDVVFGFGDVNYILNRNKEHFRNFLQKPIESIFIYSCMARRRFMQDLTNLEIEPFYSVAPTSGFFTYGEFFTSKKSELLNQTMTIFALSEEINYTKDISIKKEIQDIKTNTDTIDALSHLIEVSSSQLQKQNQMQTDVYQELYKIGKHIDETIKEDKFFNIATKFVVDKLKFEKCIIFKYDDSNKCFKIEKAIGYDKPKEQKISDAINLLLSGEIMEYLRVSTKPIVHTKLHPDLKVQKLVNSLFLSEAYFELFGGDIEVPYGLVVVGNGFKDLEKYSRVTLDKMIMLALGNFTVQLSNTIKNIIFYRAWEDEKRLLEEKIKIRTEELNKQKESFEAIYNGSKDAIAILDIKSNFLQVNPAYTDMTGFTKEELLKTSCLALTAKKDLEASKKAMSEVLKVGFIKNFEKSCIIKDGFIVITNMSMSLLKNPDRILISIRDITKLKQTQKALEMQKIKAEDATKAKSEFLANMSHEIRTPMNGIIGMAHLALSSNLDEKQKEYIQNINNSAKSLLGIINDILDYSKAEAGKIILEKVDFDLVALIESVINMLKIKADEKNLNILIKYEKDLGRYFYGDSLRLKQIITNLLSNAIKFTDKGNIELSVKMILKDRFIFEVTDTGIGLTKDEQSKLFKSFSQADGSVTRKYGGTGLGLSISKQLVELMDGRIWLESELGVGSKFIFEITLELKDDIIKDKEVYSQNHIKNINQKTLNIYKKTISKQMLEKLFLDLENALKTKRPKKCEIAIKELDIYLLEEKDTKIFNKIKKHVSSYRFKDAIKLLQERI